MGSTLAAQLIESSTGNVPSTVATVDTLYAAGFGGVLVGTEYNINDLPVAPIIRTFGAVQVVPEASMVSLVVAGIGVLVVIRGQWAR